MDSSKIVLLTDDSFANAEGVKSQLGYIIQMVDKNERCNILYYRSNKCQKIARSVMSAELQALVLDFDYAYLMKDLMEEIIGKSMNIEAMIDSKRVFNVVAKDGKQQNAVYKQIS